MLTDKNDIAAACAQASPARCFHCDEIIPEGVTITTEVGGEQRAVCCHGCKAVVETIFLVIVLDAFFAVFFSEIGI